MQGWLCWTELVVMVLTMIYVAFGILGFIYFE